MSDIPTPITHISGLQTYGRQHQIQMSIKKDGWIGRYIDYEMPAFTEAQPTVPPALQIGTNRSGLSGPK
ncbi:MAG: hypothetical protein IPL08_17230 [Saprospiraceae bacterium]|nr:hypothetical protein [Saprospiraceae bacterium]